MALPDPKKALDIYHYEFAALSGIENIALDESLLEVAGRLGVPIFRFYCWNEPTVSLGYFQRYEDRRRHQASLLCPVVRRLSGGGAIVHDQEITYCLAVPPGHVWAAEHRLRLYETVHRAAIAALAEYRVDAFLAGDREELYDKKPDKETFLCFQRVAPGDVVTKHPKFGLVKILGSAQYRDKGGAVLQHGSLLWEKSTAAPELPGLYEICGLEKDAMPSLMKRWLSKLSDFFTLSWHDLHKKEAEPTLAMLREKRYAEGWIMKR